MNLTDWRTKELLRDLFRGRYPQKEGERVFRQVVSDACLKTERLVFEYCALMFLQELHYEFGFGRKRLERFAQGFSEKAQAFDAGAYDLDDMRDALKQDVGFELKVVWNDEKSKRERV